MSERMTPIPFKQLMTWIKEEHDNFGTVFGVNAPYVKKNGKTLPLFKEKLETPFGPAAGPNTQLAQNIVAAYYAGARFFELKTVQNMDGDAPAYGPRTRATTASGPPSCMFHRRLTSTSRLGSQYA